MSSRRSVATAALAMAFLCACRRSRPNVLIITIDTLRADRLGCYGFSLAKTPAIDAMSHDGVTSANAVASAPLTMPAHSSIFTGLLPPGHGVRDNGAYALGDDAVTLAERLKDAGYTTHAFVSALVLNRRYNLNQGFETYDDDLWAEDEPKLFMIRERRARGTADRYMKWFDGWKATKSRPFFTWVHFFDPHQPYRAESADVTVAVSPYDAEIATVDRQIGRIVDALRNSGDLDSTLLIITADHGESLGEHGEMTHGIFVYDATVRVPLIVRAPWLFKPGMYGGPVRSVDIMPTVLDALDIRDDVARDGRSLLAEWRQKRAPDALPQYSESLLSEVGFGMAPVYAIRRDGYKYIRAPRPELYDLRSDPREEHNLFTSQRSVAARLDAELTQLMDASRRHGVKPAANPMTRESEESLQALGYLAPRAERNSMQGMDPKDGLPLHNKLEEARHFAQAKQWSSAENVLHEILDVTPRNVSALNVLAVIGLKSGQLDKAAEYCRRSLGVDSKQFRVYNVLGTLAFVRGDFDESMRDFRTALEINPYFAEAMANIGFVESLRGHEAAAELWYRKGIAADPTFPRVHRRLGDLYYDRGDFARAYDYYQKTTQLIPSDMRAVLQAGNCARRLGRAAEADALFQRAEKLRPDAWTPAYNRACLQAVNGKPEVALQTLQALASHTRVPLQVVESDPDLASVRALPEYSRLRPRLRRVTEDE